LFCVFHLARTGSLGYGQARIFHGIVDGTKPALCHASPPMPCASFPGGHGIGIVCAMLTDTKLRNLKPTGKLYKVADRDGLYVAVTPSGTISFRYNYALNGRQETITFGRYGPGGITLAEALWTIPKERRKRRNQHLVFGGLSTYCLRCDWLGLDASFSFSKISFALKLPPKVIKYPPRPALIRKLHSRKLEIKRCAFSGDDFH